MDMSIAARSAPKIPLLSAYARLETRLRSTDWLPGLALLAVRLWLAKFFFFSGLTKIANFTTTTPGVSMRSSPVPCEWISSKVLGSK